MIGKQGLVGVAGVGLGFGSGRMAENGSDLFRRTACFSKAPPGDFAQAVGRAASDASQHGPLDEPLGEPRLHEGAPILGLEKREAGVRQFYLHPTTSRLRLRHDLGPAMATARLRRTKCWYDDSNSGNPGPSGS